MDDILIWACTYMFTMFFAFWLKCRGIFKTEDRNLLSTIIFTVTLPAMLVSSFSGIAVDFWFIVSFILGLAVNVVMIAAGIAASRRKSPEMKGIYTINAAGLNLGNIGIPFLSNFFPAAIPYLCMFDTADSFFSLGTTYALAQIRMGKKGGARPGLILSSLFHSIPFVVYVIMTLVSLFHIALPSPVLAMADFMGRGNGFLVMMMIGISLEPKMEKENVREVAELLALRWGSGIVCALAVFFLLPSAPLVMRQALAAGCFSAVPSAAMIYSNKLGVSMKVPSALSSLSAVFMVPAMCIVIALVR